jgi:tetratricopeptide (TPR) repeat protein
MQETEHLVLSKFVIILIIFLSSQLLIFSQEFPDPNIHLMLQSGIESIILQNYDEAKQTFSKIENEYPEIPLGKIYLAAVEIAKAYDYAEPFNEDFIVNKLEEAEKQSSALLDVEENNIWNIYFLALSKGYMAYYRALKGDWLSSISAGVNSISGFEKCLQINPEFYEAYTALGSYKYWKSRKTEFLNWLPFIEDEKQEGIEHLKKAITHSSYNTYLAINSLIWIYIDNGEFNEAIKISQEALKKYPGSRFFKYGLARAYEEIDHSNAIECYNKILNSYPQTKNSNRYNEVVLKHKIAQQYAKMGEKQKALELCNEILNIKDLSEYVRTRLSDRLDRIRALQKELSE